MKANENASRIPEKTAPAILVLCLYFKCALKMIEREREGYGAK
jgi:hypothetical protein